MNSERAAAVRDSINGCPDIVDPEDTGDYGKKLEDRQHGGVTVTFTGEHFTPDSTFAPARVEQVGTISNGEGAERPVHAVILTTLWHESDDARSLSPELIYEVAKHNCHLRFYPPDHRLDGDLWIVDPMSQLPSDTDGDRCDKCGSTYFKFKDDEPTCAKCGAPKNTESETVPQPQQ